LECNNLALRDVIKEITKTHLLEKNGLAMGQCLTAVGWVGGTLPELYESEGMIELSMADVAGGGFVVGAGLAGRRPMYIIRYQGFNWFNSPIIINYACKSKDIWQRPCPIFIRSIAMEGAIGPVAGSSHHSLYYRMPGVKILSPMTPMEYRLAYKEFMNDDDVYYISEHRSAYSNANELPDMIADQPDFALFPISITRFAAQEAALELKNIYDLNISVNHIFRIKPFTLGSKEALKNLSKSKYGGCVLDDDYVDGIAKNIAYDLAVQSGASVKVMGLEDKTAGFAANVDNLPPSKEKIKNFILNIVGKGAK